MGYLEAVSILGRKIRVTKSYWDYIVRIKHREVTGLEEDVVKALSSPLEVRRSKKDHRIYLYYRRYGDKFICVVAKHLNEEGFIVTVYMARSFGGGELVWRD